MKGANCDEILGSDPVFRASIYARSGSELEPGFKLEYSPQDDGFTGSKVCLVCRNDAGDSVTAILSEVTQSSKCTAIKCYCDNAFTKIDDGLVIPKDATLEYSENEKDFGNAFDSFFKNSESSKDSAK